jgi:hypothetical protein
VLIEELKQHRVRQLKEDAFSLAHLLLIPDASHTISST